MALKKEVMDLFLTMAGEYSRFKNDGFKLPKFLLPWGDRTILSSLLHEFSNLYRFENIYLIMHEKDMDYYNHIAYTLESFDYPRENIIIIDKTDSQSQTLLKGLDFTKKSRKFIVHNIDTLLYNRNFYEISEKLDKFDGFIDLFTSQNHKYSYVLRNDNKITNISEKILISNEATSGLYGFSSSDIFRKYYVNGYISEIYDKMITDGKEIITDNIIHTEDNTLVLGTPSEYENLAKLKLR